MDLALEALALCALGLTALALIAAVVDEVIWRLKN